MFVVCNVSHTLQIDRLDADSGAFINFYIITAPNQIPKKETTQHNNGGHDFSLALCKSGMVPDTDYKVLPLTISYRLLKPAQS